MKGRGALARVTGTYRPKLPPEAGEIVALREASGMNALLVGWAVVDIERHARDVAVDHVTIPIYGAQALGYDLLELRAVLRELFLFVLARDIEITFESWPVQGDLSQATEGGQTIQNLCLFSGGVDSFAGILAAKHEVGQVEGVFCAHSDQSKIIGLVERFAQTALAQEKIGLRRTPGPRLGSRGYVQLRGFLYVLSAGMWVNRLGANRIFVTECGPTMFQPRFSPLDAVTMTTHPIVVQSARDALRILMARPIEVVTPFAEWTKAEVMAASSRKWELWHTHSCVSQRFARHDGTCYGCVVRRLAAIAAGVRDVRYTRNPLWDERASGGNLLSLLNYCCDLLLGYGGMEEYERQEIERYNKRELFRRFALDNLAALHLLAGQRKRLRRSIWMLYSEVLAELGKETLDQRLHELRTGPRPTANFG